MRALAAAYPPRFYFSAFYLLFSFILFLSNLVLSLVGFHSIFGFCFPIYWLASLCIDSLL